MTLLITTKSNRKRQEASTIENHRQIIKSIIHPESRPHSRLIAKLRNFSSWRCQEKSRKRTHHCAMKSSGNCRIVYGIENRQYCKVHQVQCKVKDCYWSHLNNEPCPKCNTKDHEEGVRAAGDKRNNWGGARVHHYTSTQSTQTTQSTQFTQSMQTKTEN